MTLARGLAADSSWRLPLSGSARATVESSFEHALNLETRDGSLLTVTTRSGRPAPGALLTGAATLPRIAPGTEVRFGAPLQVGPLTVDWPGCRWFECGVSTLARVHPAREVLLTAAADRAAQVGSFRVAASATPFERALSARLSAAAESYRGALRSGVGIDRAALGLIGLGAGLTPSGDDYLVGSLAVLHLIGAARHIAPIAAALDEAGATTTRVGRHFLTAAVAGEFHHDVAQAALAALTGSDDLDRSVAALAGLGSTSGTDTITGLLDTLTTLTPLPHHAQKEAIS